MHEVTFPETGVSHWEMCPVEWQCGFSVFGGELAGGRVGRSRQEDERITKIAPNYVAKAILERKDSCHRMVLLSVMGMEPPYTKSSFKPR